LTGSRGNGSGISAVVLGAVLVLASTVVSAEGSTPSLAGPAAAQGAALLRLLVALGAVLLVFWICARVFARFGGHRSANPAGLEVLGSVSLGQRERLVMVRAGGTRLVLGVTASAITPVHVLGPEGDAEASGRTLATDVAAASGPSTSDTALRNMPSGPDFAARLRAALARSAP